MKKILFYLGGTLLVVGAVLPTLLPAAAPWTLALGALLFAPIQIMERYEGRNVIIRHLRRQQILGALLLVVAAMLLFCSHFEIKPFRGNEWMIALVIATILEVYTAFRIGAEEEKEKRG